MRRFRFFLLVGLGLLTSGPVFAEQPGTERFIKENAPPIREQKEKIYFSSDYETSWVKLGARRINWQLFSNRIAYLRHGIQSPYLQVDQYNRDHNRDTTIDFGSYFRFKNSYGELGTGFGTGVTYIYKFQATAEFAHRIFKNLFLKDRERFLRYVVGDTLISSPGLVYYVGDHYVTADYNIAVTEDRDPAHWVTLKGLYHANDYVNLGMGWAFGERLYDIFPIPASGQQSYLFFTRMDLKPFTKLSTRFVKNMTFQIGYTYGEERPSFASQSLSFGLSLTF